MLQKHKLTYEYGPVDFFVSQVIYKYHKKYILSLQLGVGKKRNLASAQTNRQLEYV